MEKQIFNILYKLNNIKYLDNKDKKIWLLNKPSKEVKCYTEVIDFIKLGWIEIFNKD